MKKKYILTIIILIAIILLTSGFLLGNYSVKNNIHFKKNNTLKLDTTNATVIKLYNQVNPSTDTSIIKGLYEPNYSNDYILSVGIINYLQNNNLKNEPYISQKEVDKYIHRILGYSLNYLHQTVYILDSKLGICGYWYHENQKQYELIPGCGNNPSQSVHRKIVKAQYQGDTIEITEKLIYEYHNLDEYSNKIYIYNNIQKEKLLNYYETSYLDNYKSNIDDYLSEASTYIYTFKYQYDHYILKSIQKI